MKTMMTRHVKGKERYYRIEVLPNLFGEYLLIRTYGSSSRLKPSGVIGAIYSQREDAEDSMAQLRSQKIKRGYFPCNNYYQEN